MKVCRICGLEKSLDEFYKCKGTKDGYRTECKVCSSEIKRQCRIKNAEHYKEYDLARKNDKKRQQMKKQIDKDYYKANKERLNARKKEYYQENKEYFSKINKQWREEHKDQIKEYGREYRKTYEKTPQRIAYNKEYKNRPLVKFRENVRTLIRQSINKRSHYIKKSKTEEILGCTIKEFMKYIESKFQDGMTWENHGKWHLDHIIPVSIAKTEEEVIKLNHYTNYQPLWAEDNLKKSNKI